MDYTVCVDWTNKDANCYAVDNTDANVNNYKCKYCKTGYILNEDNICEKFTPPFCKADNFATLSYFNPLFIEASLKLLPNG